MTRLRVITRPFWSMMTMNLEVSTIANPRVRKWLWKWSGFFFDRFSVALSINRTGNVTSSVVKSRFIRRGSAKLRKPSVRMKDPGKSKQSWSSAVRQRRRVGLLIHIDPSRPSFRARRRSHVLNLSTENTAGSTFITHPMMETTNEASLTSGEDLFDQGDFDTMISNRLFPWIKVAIRIFSRINLNCDHRAKCLENCYKKQRNSCANLTQALTNMYQSVSDITPTQRHPTTTSRPDWEMSRDRVRLFEILDWTGGNDLS